MKGNKHRSRNQWIWKEYYEQYYTYKFDNLNEMSQFLEKHKPNLPNMKQVILIAL